MTREKSCRMAVLVGAGLFLLIAVGPCLWPAVPDISTQQLMLANRLIAAMHEEIVAARAPPVWRFALFLIALFVPLGGVIWLLNCARKDAVTHDEEIRTLVRSGRGGPFIQSYIEEAENRAKEALPRDTDSGSALSVGEVPVGQTTINQNVPSGRLRRAWSRIRSKWFSR